MVASLEAVVLLQPTNDDPIMLIARRRINPVNKTFFTSAHPFVVFIYSPNKFVVGFKF